MKHSLSLRCTGSIITLLNYYISTLFQRSDKCVTVQFTHLHNNLQMTFSNVRNGQKGSFSWICSSNKLLCGQVCLQNQTPLHSLTELYPTTIRGRHKMAAATMSADGNSDIKGKSKGFLQSNSAQMDLAWTLLLHSIKFIKTRSNRQSEAGGEGEG